MRGAESSWSGALSVCRLRWLRGRGLALSAWALALTALLPAAPAYAVPSRTDYMLVAHPDDEYQMFSVVRGSTATYKIFIYMSRGEETSYCRTEGEVAPSSLLGPYGYQGPHSLGGGNAQPDRDERHPATGSTTLSPSPSWHPWSGRWTNNCINGRMQGTMRFLQHLNAIDSTMPGNFTTGTTYFNLPTNGVSPRRSDNGVLTPINNYATVYRGQNGMGAAVFFDLGDGIEGDTTVAEVRWALETTVARRSSWGLPQYDGSGGDTVSSYYRTPLANCDTYTHGDHKSTYDALVGYDAPGADLGRTCGEGGLTGYISTAVHDPLWQLSTPVTSSSYRQGAFQQQYGWLTATHWGLPSASSPFWRDQRFVLS